LGLSFLDLKALKKNQIKSLMMTTKLFQNGFSDISLIIAKIKIVPKCGNGR